MQLELKKRDLESYLLTIQAMDAETGKMVSGLLNENIKLGSKRKLQKLHKQLLPVYKEYIEDIKQTQSECGDDKEKLKVELEELINEDIKLEIDPIDLSSVENVSSTTNYNFDIIEKIAI